MYLFDAIFRFSFTTVVCGFFLFPIFFFILILGWCFLKIVIFLLDVTKQGLDFRILQPAYVCRVQPGSVLTLLCCGVGGLGGEGISSQNR